MSNEVDLKAGADIADAFRRAYPEAKVVTGTYDEDGTRTMVTEAVKALGEIDEERVRREFSGPVPTMREWIGDAQGVVILVHPLEGESVVDTLRRAFAPHGLGTCTVQTADGPRDVDVPAQLAGVVVIETTLVPAGEVRITSKNGPSLSQLDGLVRL